MTRIRARIKGVGSYLPDRVMTNSEFVNFVDTSDDWIRTHTGIIERRIAASDELTSHIGSIAASRALDDSGLSASAINGIIFATATPDHAFPSCAARVQAELSCINAFAMDLQCACSGFLYGLSVAQSMIESGAAKNILLVGGDIMSRIVDWKDRNTCILFGDGAGAFVLSASNEFGILSSSLYSDGSLADILHTADNNVVDNGLDGGLGNAEVIKMNGKLVFRHAIEKMSDAVLHELARNDISIDDINWLVPHQANVRILRGMADRLSLPIEKMLVTVGEHANTSAASIPLAVDWGIKQSLLKVGDRLVLAAVGGGLSWAATVLEW